MCMRAAQKWLLNRSWNLFALIFVKTLLLFVLVYTCDVFSFVSSKISKWIWIYSFSVVCKPRSWALVSTRLRISGRTINFSYPNKFLMGYLHFRCESKFWDFKSMAKSMGWRIEKVWPNCKIVWNKFWCFSSSCSVFIFAVVFIKICWRCLRMKMLTYEDVPVIFNWKLDPFFFMLPLEMTTILLFFLSI